MDEITISQLDHEFGKLPDEEQREHFAAINEAAKAFAKEVIKNVPRSSDRDHAVRAIRGAAMWAKDALLTYSLARIGESESTNRWSVPAEDGDYWVPTPSKVKIRD